MKKHEKLRKEAEALKSFADTLEANNELHREIVTRTDFATSQLLDNKVTPEAIEVYQARIHRINLDNQALNCANNCAQARLRAQLKEIEANFCQEIE